MKKLLTFLSTLITISSWAQNWSYVGTPYINNSISTSTYLYFGDMEMDAAGNVLVGYWEYSGILSFAKYDGNSWSKLPAHVQ